MTQIFFNCSSSLKFSDRNSEEQNDSLPHNSIGIIEDTIPIYDKEFDLDGENVRFSRNFAKDSFGKNNLYAFHSHDAGRVLGSEKSGTLKVADTKDGIYYKLYLPDTSDGRDVKELVKRGDFDGSSFDINNWKFSSSSSNYSTGVNDIVYSKIQHVSPVFKGFFNSGELKSTNFSTKENCMGGITNWFNKNTSTNFYKMLDEFSKNFSNVPENIEQNIKNKMEISESLLSDYYNYFSDKNPLEVSKLFSENLFKDGFLNDKNDQYCLKFLFERGKNMKEQETFSINKENNLELNNKNTILFNENSNLKKQVKNLEELITASGGF